MTLKSGDISNTGGLTLGFCGAQFDAEMFLRASQGPFPHSHLSGSQEESDYKPQSLVLPTASDFHQILLDRKELKPVGRLPLPFPRQSVENQWREKGSGLDEPHPGEWPRVTVIYLTCCWKSSHRCRFVGLLRDAGVVCVGCLVPPTTPRCERQEEGLHASPSPTAPLSLFSLLREKEMSPLLIDSDRGGGHHREPW